jgi:hypothetical protein
VWCGDLARTIELGKAATEKNWRMEGEKEMGDEREKPEDENKRWVGRTWSRGGVTTAQLDSKQQRYGRNHES